MAPIKNSLVALVAAVCMIPSITYAAPVNHLNKRMLVVETVTDIVWTTIDLTTTVYLPNYTPPAQNNKPTSSAEVTPVVAQFFDANPEPSPSSTTTSSIPTSTTAQAPPPPPSTTAPPPPPPPPTSPSPSPTSTAINNAPVIAQVAPPPPEEPSSSSTPPPAPSPSVAAQSEPQPQTSSGAGGGSPSGQCTESAPCMGDITFYQAGLGACGFTNDGSTEDVLALPVGMMGSQSNGNPFCGSTVTIKNGDKTATGVVVDKCMGCEGESIDLSNHLFDQLGLEEDGRIPGVEWWFS